MSICAFNHCSTTITLISAELPLEEKLIAQGHSVLETTDSWKQGKIHHKVVKTLSRPKFKGEIADWHCRVSEHGSEDATFDEFWSKLAENKGQNEVKYVALLFRYPRERI